jgi:hypothetical protein
MIENEFGNPNNINFFSQKDKQVDRINCQLARHRPRRSEVPIHLLPHVRRNVQSAALRLATIAVNLLSSLPIVFLAKTVHGFGIVANLRQFLSSPDQVSEAQSFRICG